MTPHERRAANEAMRGAFSDWHETRQDFVKLAEMLNAAASRAVREHKTNRDSA